MQQVQTEDITVPWGQAPDPLDHQFGKWRLSVFQDLQESLDQSKIYFLYDPISDDRCITTGARKGMTSLVVFDAHKKCFVAEILLRVQGRVKFFFALKSPSPAGGTSFALVTQSEDYGQFVLHVWRLNLSADGLSVAQDPFSLLRAPLQTGDEFICTMREDTPELVVVHGPGMNVVRVGVDATGPQEPIDRFNVAGSELSHFYDGLVSRGNVYFLSASPDGHLDYGRVHVLSLAGRGPLVTQYCQPDPQRGMPPPRKQAALDGIAGFVMLAGGEIDYGGGNVTRLVDYWVLDVQTFKWNQIPAQMPVALIEPRLTSANSGNIYVWGDFDEPLPGMPQDSTHVRILRVRGLNVLSPPGYDQAMGGGAAPYPPQGGGGYGSSGPAPYPPQGGGYSQQPYGGGQGGQQPAYGQQPQYGGGQPPYGQQQQQQPQYGFSGQQQPSQQYPPAPYPAGQSQGGGAPPPQYAYYPDQRQGQ